ncbi:aminotransferase class V-fold PLP-dependent enzyme [Streptomyces sp. NBC_01233]|uniref:aminotransferase class V-fold PLP-dependent enzyme n=1 Tax=Streptomyces sp. NBC_01233 TaxID=2903787 RepID=UPI002E157671|nr:aminotransferase class V-fold PLP-dependent enzyme [Streptomyces sp. NBC_01233]
MDLLTEATRAEFAHSTTYLNTANCGVLPRSTVAAVRELAEAAGAGVPAGFGDFDRVNRSRAAFGRLVGVDAERVAVGSAVSTHVGLVAASLPPGAEVLCPEGDFASVINPFVVRGDLKVCFAPLESLAEAVGPDTALVSLSAVQSADGRLADLSAVRAATTAHGARMLVDATQAAGWLPFDASSYDYTVTAGYKWLLGARGASFLTVSQEAQPTLTPLHAGWVAAESMWDATYGPMPQLAHGARRFDESPAFLAYHAAEASLALIERIGIDVIHAHDTALAARYRAGLARLGHEPVPGGAAIVSVPGLADRQPALQAAGIATSARAGALRASFHLYSTEADVDRLLDVLSAS